MTLPFSVLLIRTVGAKARGRVIVLRYGLRLSLAMLLFLADCQKPRTVSPLLYILLPQLRGGNERPTTPAHLQWSYVIPVASLYLKWDTSIDPDTGSVVPLYRVYLSETVPPDSYYQQKNLLTESGKNDLYIQSDPLSQALYFYVTGFDGQAESYPSNLLQVNMQDQTHWVQEVPP